MFDPIQDVIKAYAKGEVVIIVDDEDRENEGDFCVAAEKVTPEIINFMAIEGRGLICLALDSKIANTLDLPPMVSNNTSNFGTNFTVSIDAAEGVTTGISAHDRAKTILTCVKDGVKPSELVRPGHIFPLRAVDGGVLIRAGQTEASVDLAKMGGLKGAGVICEIMNPDGTMMRLNDLRKFADKHHLKLTSVEEIQKFRIKNNDFHIKNTVSANLPTEYGMFRIHFYKNTIDFKEHIVLTCGDIKPEGKAIEKPVLVRVHSECFTGDVLHSTRCDCGEQLHKAQKMILEAGAGVIIYLRQEGRGIGLENKLKAYNLQDQGYDTFEANTVLGLEPDMRTYGLGAQMLYHLGVRKIRLITNNPSKVTGIQGYGLDIVERVSLETRPTESNLEYLKAKKVRFGHFLNDDNLG